VLVVWQFQDAVKEDYRLSRFAIVSRHDGVTSIESTLMSLAPIKCNLQILASARLQGYVEFIT